MQIKKYALSRICFAVMFSFAVQCGVAEQTPNRFERELQPYIEQFMQTQEIPGMAIAVVRDGRVLYAHGFGVKTLNPAVVPAVFPQGTHTAGPVTTRTLFHTASVTKTFVAAAVMQLVSQGKIKLDTPVVAYIPTFEMADPRYRSITVRQLLDHTSGMPDRTGIKGHGWDHPERDDQALHRFVATLKTEKLEFDPGSRFEYSNTGYEVLGDLIARVSGETFEAYISEHILAPLGMKDSSLLLKGIHSNLLATGHETDDAEDPMAMQIFPSIARSRPAEDWSQM